MASDDSERLRSALAGPLRDRGFRKDGATWRKRYPEAIGVINLQRSRWGPAFYINLGVYFTAIGSNGKPAEHHCHVRARLDGIVPDGERLLEVLDLGKPVADDVRAKELEAAIVGGGLPWLDRAASPREARALRMTGGWPVVTGEARRYLDSLEGS